MRFFATDSSEAELVMRGIKHMTQSSLVQRLQLKCAGKGKGKIEEVINALNMTMSYKIGTFA